MKKARKLYLLKTPKGLWQEIMINIIGPLSKLKDKNTIVIIVDQFTKMIRLKVTIKIFLSEDIAKFIETTSGNYMEYHRKFSVTEDLSSLYNS